MEWSQDATLLATTYSHQQNIDGSSAAFIQSDFSFRGPNDRSISPSTTLGVRSDHKTVIWHTKLVIWSL